MKDQIVTLNVGPSQLLSQLCDEIRLEDIINEQVTWDQARCGLSPGTRIKAILLNILAQGNPLYKINEFYETQDVEQLFGAGIIADHFNDDALGRALDYLYKAVPWKVYTSLALSALKVLELRLGTLHNDTTSFSVYGQYLNDSDAETKLNITYGHSKQKRPDLKQIVLGISVTPERIPVLAKVEDGNTSDKAWNLTFIKKMRETLNDHDWSNLLYQADSALITKENLKELADYELDFLSRLPDTFTLSTELKSKAWATNDWQNIGTLTDKKEAAMYRLQTFEDEIDGQTYRFVVVHSDQLAKLKANKLVRDGQKEREQFEKEMTTLHKGTFHCLADAQEAKQAFEKAHRLTLHRYQLSIDTEELPIKRAKRGRPKKEDQLEFQTVYRVHLALFEPDHDALETKRQLLSTFILITNKLEETTFSALDVLKTYKGQTAAETRFRLLKEEQMIDAVFLKTPERIEALGIVYVMALLLYGMLEYRIRTSMKQETEPLILMGKRKLFAPTGKALLEQLADIQLILIRQNGQTMRFLPDNIKDQTKRIVTLIGYDMSIYISDTPKKNC
ncbi:IS1634 family transposase [Sporosarcina sp. FSL K6-3457]|uniref:IS1634 family transposase n=1 Tax=Sporosarcina sp. FSL K6-3457 TaxID=2978204 RepID=UPI0030F95A5C